ncbi:MAG: BNR-4 repeat-containing protein [Planctomycetota bacterium]
MRRRPWICLSSAGLLMLGAVTAFSGKTAAGQSAGEPSTTRITELAPSGAWCWFQDPRAVYYEGRHRRTYTGWITLAGDVQVASIDADTGETVTRTVREKLEADDHDNPVILVAPDGRLTVFYSKHNGPDLFYRKSVDPESIHGWGPEQTVSTNTRGQYKSWGYTYYHPMRLSREGGKTYLFWRGGNWKPTFSATLDGKTWTEARNLLMSNERRPYMKVCSNGRDSIHFAYTSGDPNPKETKVTSLYHALYRNEALHRADGARICTLDEVPFDHTEGDLLWDHEATGDRAWVWDIALDAEDKPVVVFVMFPDPDDDHRYQYARWDGKRWNVHEITRSAGGFTLPLADGTRTSPSYAGGITLSHSDPSTVYVSAKRGGVFEIEKWTTADQGETWTSEAVTSGSTKNNVRPVVPWGFNGRGVEVLWMHGDYYYWKARYHTAIRMRTVKP